MLQLAGTVGAPRRAASVTHAFFRLCLAFLAMVLLLLGWQAAARAETEFLEPEKAFVFSAQMASPDTLELHYRVAPGYYMYRERFGISISPPDATTLGEAVYPKGEVKYDPTFEKDMEVFHKDVVIRVPVGAGGQPFTLTLTGQGCADAGLCYPPMDSSVKLTPVAGGYALAGAGAGAAPASSAASGGLSALVNAGDTSLADALGGLGWIKTAGVFLLLGLLLAFTPCVLPMIPILSSIVLGGAVQQRPTRGRGLALAATYVLGMSVVYTALGVAAGLSGAGLAAWLQTPWILTLFAILLAVLALAMFDVFTFQMPSGIQARLSERSLADSWRALHGRAGDGGLVGADRRALRGRAAGRRAVVYLADRRCDPGRFRVVRDGLGNGRSSADRGCVVGRLVAQGRAVDGWREAPVRHAVAGDRLVDADSRGADVGANDGLGVPGRRVRSDAAGVRRLARGLRRRAHVRQGVGLAAGACGRCVACRARPVAVGTCCSPCRIWLHGPRRRRVRQTQMGKSTSPACATAPSWTRCSPKVANR